MSQHPITHAVMIGSHCPNGPGGRDCPCCGDAPGKDRTRARRSAKRRERQHTRRLIAQQLADDES